MKSIKMKSTGRYRDFVGFKIVKYCDYCKVKFVAHHGGQLYCEPCLMRLFGRTVYVRDLVNRGKNKMISKKFCGV